MQRINASYQEWLDKVEEDEFAGKEILDGRRFAAPACFHFQQMTEKLLKALLIFYNIPFPKIHDLITLAGMLEPMTPEIKNYKSDLEFLGRYYVETRYPGDYPEFTFEECERALASALRIKKFVTSKVKPPKQNGGFGLVGIIIALAVVVLAVGGGWYYYRNQQLTTDNQQQAVANNKSTGGVKQTMPTQVRTMTSTDSVDTTATMTTVDLAPFQALYMLTDDVDTVIPLQVNMNITNWKVYRNEKYGFEVKYPPVWIAVSVQNSSASLEKIDFGSEQDGFLSMYIWRGDGEMLKLQRRAWEVHPSEGNFGFSVDYSVDGRPGFLHSSYESGGEGVYFTNGKLVIDVESSNLGAYVDGAPDVSREVMAAFLSTFRFIK